jgi:hypothetical protein
VHPEVLNCYIDGNLVLEPKSQAESELRSGMESLKPEEAAAHALLRSHLAKEGGVAKAAGTRSLIIPALMLSRITCRPSKSFWRSP